MQQQAHSSGAPVSYFLQRNRDTAHGQGYAWQKQMQLLTIAWQPQAHQRQLHGERFCLNITAFPHIAGMP